MSRFFCYALKSKGTLTTIVLCLSIAFLSGVNCKKQDIAAPKESVIVPPKFISDTSFTVSFAEAGVSFIINELKDTLYTKREYNGVPSIDIDDANVLYCAWFCRNKIKGSWNNTGEGVGNYITLAVSNDLGDTWHNNALIIAAHDTTVGRVYDPGLWRDKKGRLHIFWSKPLVNWRDGWGAVWESIIFVRDGYVHFTPPRLFFKNGILLNKPIYNRVGDVLYPHYVYNFLNTEVRGGVNIYMQYGADIIPPDNYFKVDIDHADAAKSEIMEPMLLEMRDSDSVGLFIRTPGGIYYSKSVVKSHTATPPFAFRKLESIGENANSRFHIRRLHSGNTLLIANSSKGRTNMTLFLSENDHLLFEHKRTIDKRIDISYPDATEDKDGNIFMVYDRDRINSREINFARFRESNINPSDTSPIRVKQINIF